MRRFDIPAAPSVAGGRGDLLRLVDPRGLAVAWLDPQAARCVGYAVRPAGVAVGGWRELFGGTGGSADLDRGSPAGGTIGGSWPWADEMPHQWPARWQLLERDPTATTLVCHCKHRTNNALAADLFLSASLDDGTLRLRLVVRTTVATPDCRAQFRLVVPGASSAVSESVTVEQPEAIVLRRAASSWRFLITPEPSCSITRAVAGDEAGVIVTAVSAPRHADTARENTCVLTVTVMPLE